MTKPRLVDDCFQTSEQLITHHIAIDQLRQRTSCVTGSVTLPLDQAGGRYLGEDITAKVDVPGHDNAAVDGYAYHSRDLVTGKSVELALIGRSAAGQPFSGTIAKGQAVRILTGAVVPPGCDSVIMQEDVSVSDDKSRVELPVDARAGANIRPAGEDIKTGTHIFAAGHRLRPQDMATLASLGIHQVKCREKLSVGVISTGDEIIPAGPGALPTGQVYDANTPMLMQALATAGHNATSLGIWPDDASVVRQRLKAAADDFDVLITSGGASQGDEDHLAAAIAALGTRYFWRLAVKPGRPIMFGQIGSVPIVGLPGNPVAVFVCFLIYLFPMLQVLAGGHWPVPRRYKIPADFEIKSRKLGRREFWRANLVATGNGHAVRKYPRDGSGLITSLREANGLIEVGEDVASITPGDLVEYIPFSEFGILD